MTEVVPNTIPDRLITNDSLTLKKFVFPLLFYGQSSISFGQTLKTLGFHYIYFISWKKVGGNNLILCFDRLKATRNHDRFLSNQRVLVAPVSDQGPPSHVRPLSSEEVGLDTRGCPDSVSPVGQRERVSKVSSERRSTIQVVVKKKLIRSKHSPSKRLKFVFLRRRERNKKFILK